MICFVEEEPPACNVVVDEETSSPPTTTKYNKLEFSKNKISTFFTKFKIFEIRYITSIIKLIMSKIN